MQRYAIYFHLGGLDLYPEGANRSITHHFGRRASFSMRHLERAAFIMGIILSLLREHSDLVPEHIRTKVSLMPPPPPKKRGRPKKEKGGEDL